MTFMTKTAPPTDQKNSPRAQKRKPSRHCNPSQNEESHSNIKASNTSQTLQDTPKARVKCDTQNAMDTNQQHKDHNNTKPIWQTIVLCNTLRFKLKSKKTAKNSPSPIVIPKKTAK